MDFINWDWRPAVLIGVDDAFAVLSPGKGWSRVDEADVIHTGAVLSEEEWRRRFEPRFGFLDLSKIPHSSPRSRRAAE
jgi:hypothetical protein